MYIDTHCHLDSQKYKENLDEVIANSLELGVEKIIIPGADINDLDYAISISQKYDSVYFASGIHPTEIQNLDSNAKAKIKDAITNPKCVAIGEIGLDYHYFDTDDCSELKLAQERAFRFQIELALSNNLPIIIHTRDSNDDVVRILKDYDNDIIGLVFHCFGGDKVLLNALNCPTYYGIGGVVSFKNAQILRDTLRDIPLSSLILETDAPYLAPVPHRGKVNTPEYIPLIASHLAQTLNFDINTIAASTTSSAKKLFF